MNFENPFKRKSQDENLENSMEKLVEEKVAKDSLTDIDSKNLEELLKDKQSMVDLYSQRANTAIEYQDKKDQIASLNPNNELRERLTQKAFDETLGEIDNKIKKIRNDGVELTPEEHRDARMNLLRKEHIRTLEKMRDYEKNVLEKNNEDLKNLSILSNTIKNDWKELDDNQKIDLLQNKFKLYHPDQITRVIGSEHEQEWVQNKVQIKYNEIITKYRNEEFDFNGNENPRKDMIERKSYVDLNNRQNRLNRIMVDFEFQRNKQQ